MTDPNYIPDYVPINPPPPPQDPPAAPAAKGPHPLRAFMRGAPLANGNPTVFQPKDADAIMTHLELCGMVHDPSKQKIRAAPPEHGPDVWVNPCRWVGIDDPEPVPSRHLDLSELTDEQAEALQAEQELVSKALRQREIDKQIQDGADPHVRYAQEEES